MPAAEQCPFSWESREICSVSGVYVVTTLSNGIFVQPWLSNKYQDAYPSVADLT
jgi:hypothetical protein